MGEIHHYRCVGVLFLLVSLLSVAQTRAANQSQQREGASKNESRFRVVSIFQPISTYFDPIAYPLSSAADQLTASTASYQTNRSAAMAPRDITHQATKYVRYTTNERAEVRYPAYIRFIESTGEYYPFDDEFFCDSALSVNFVVNKAVINANDPAWRCLVDSVLPLVRRSNLHFSHIEVRGSASPEGSYSNNRRLSRARSQAIIDSLSHYVYVPKNSMNVQQVVEDYDYLCVLMRKANDPRFEAVSKVVTKWHGNDAQIKRALKKMNGGSTWNYLRRTYFPQLRAARIVLYFTQPVEVPFSYRYGSSSIDRPELRAWTKSDLLVESYFDGYREPMLSVKTNLLSDLFIMPGMGYAPILNLQLEYYPHNSRYTFAAEYDFPWWSQPSRHKYFQMLNLEAEVRRYFRKDEHIGHYLTVYGHGNLYDLSLNGNEAWQGEGWGAGVGYGASRYLGTTQRWKLELFIRAGFYQSNYDPYHAGEPFKGKYYVNWSGALSDFVPRNWRLRYFGPTGIGLNLSYDLMYRPVNQVFKFSNLFRP